MKKNFWYIVTILLIAVFSVGCQSSSDGEISSDEISKVSISNSNEIGNINPDFFIVYDDEEILEDFQDIFKSAIKQEGIVE